MPHYSRDNQAPEYVQCLIESCENFTKTGICGNCIMFYSDGGTNMARLEQVEHQLWARWAQLHHPSTCTIDECMDCGVRDCVLYDPLHYHHGGCPACAIAIFVMGEDLLAQTKEERQHNHDVEDRQGGAEQSVDEP